MNYAILKKSSLCYIPTEAIYYSNNLLFTRTNELVALLSSALELNGDEVFSKEMKKIIEGILFCIDYNRDFEIVLCKTKFYAFYLNKYDGYIIQSSLKDIHDYYGIMR